MPKMKYNTAISYATIGIKEKNMACLNGKSRQEKTTDQQDTDSVILELILHSECTSFMLR